ncbi:hypothetical protein [Embleya sp. NPDC020886]|uniref:hypothetical protein n=1 Tax=Embleya sp. NPDC020886 TaxID=3363980 RepID=UPI0037959E73
MTYTPPGPAGNGDGFARAAVFVVGLFAFVVLAMTDLFVLIGFGGATESCANQACRDWYEDRLPWVFGLFAVSFVTALIALVRPGGRRAAVTLPLILAAIALQATAFALSQNGPAA